MTALIEKIASQGGATRQQLREAVAKPKAGRPKAYVFAYRPPDKTFNLKLTFSKSRASRRRDQRARSDPQGAAEDSITAGQAYARQCVASKSGPGTWTSMGCRSGCRSMAATPCGPRRLTMTANESS